MTFDQAADFVMPFGKYKGETLDRIAVTDEGLRYLDWMRGERGGVNPIDQALARYLTDPAIAKELGELNNGS